MNKNNRISIEELIQRLDRMINIHSNNPSTFMLEQYQAEKKKLVRCLEELNIKNDK